MAYGNLTNCFKGGKLARMLGGRGKKIVLSGPVARKIEAWRKDFFSNLEPKIEYGVHEIEAVQGETVWLAGGAELTSPKLAKVMREATHMLCFIATLGRSVDEKINSRMGGRRYSEGYILDAMGSVAVECLVERFHRHMEDKYTADGKSVTLRFSPGYCDWPLIEQSKLFDLVDAGRIGVELSDSCLMSPRKSVSGVFGICDGVRPLPPFNPCKSCPKKGCIARRS